MTATEPGTDGCPTADRILDAVQGKASPGVNRAIADHAATCPACFTAWRMAREYVGDASRTAAWPTSTWARVAGIAASVLIAIGIGAPMLMHDAVVPAPVPTVRAVPSGGVRPVTPEGAVLSRDRFVLQWTAGPDGSRYDVRVTDRTLERVAAAQGLDKPEFTVPGDALRSVASGGALLWQVELVQPDGRRTSSSTFSVRVK